MAHEASLVHDDILDEAIERRGRATFVAKYGAAAALLQGDHLLTAAYNLIARTRCWPLVELFAKVGEKTVAGEKLQGLSRGKEISLDKNQSILEGKTGELFGFSMAIRPMLENNPNAQKYYLLGRRLGALYQMLDDVIDYCPNTKSGKPPYQDYKQHKWTWPLLALDRPNFDLSMDELHTRLFASSHSEEPSALRREFGRLEAQHAQFKQEARDLCGDRHIAVFLADEWLTRAEEAIRHEEDKFRFSFTPSPITMRNQPVLECAQ
jgi:geranylgeranyl pyrophosphate synthase